MSVLVLMLAMLATLTSCQKQPISAPSLKGKFSVFTLAPVNSDAKKFAWYVSGRQEALTQAELKAELTWRGRETESGQSGWSEENNRSANMIGVRVDGRAPIRDFMVLVETMVEARLPKFALALLQEFDSSPSQRGGGDKFWDIDRRYLRGEFPSDEGLSRDWHV